MPNCLAFRSATAFAIPLVLTACVSTYKAPVAGPTATLGFAYIELGEKPGIASIQGWGKHSFLTGPEFWNLGKLSPAAGKTPETVTPELSLQIAADRDFKFSFHFESAGSKPVACSNSVKFTPAPNAEYLAIFFNKPSSCHPAVFRRTAQGLVTETMREPW